MVFEITVEMEKKILEWDSCRAVDVAGAKFIYKFIPTSIGMVIEVHCDICKRVLNLTDD